MQPFQSTKGPLGDTLAADSGFFFRPGQEFHVGVYDDPKDAVSTSNSNSVCTASELGMITDWVITTGYTGTWHRRYGQDEAARRWDDETEGGSVCR